ncbi:hypothetical protein PBI_ISOLDE_67 [Arthrobacter phage Isolde]|uniref:Uncharacterized protein n=1 Tax=Arthrobacter phage Isolde TaxID=2419610 RepID=A0A3G3M3P0_9CAUD|nr:hypothetical protein PP638_gp36 [Arthrobacter phage Isolde]AYR01036.1 hypothetical protein PBI_ISOLDE_67 [Arthrobacter phage Isolde]
MLGLSAQAIAYGGTDHPWDPSDLLRCINYCEVRGLSTAALQARMAGRSIQWDRLLPEWDHLAELLRHEIDTRADRTAPRTYAEMKRILNEGTACTACDSTGRGEECVKCKGTGRRSGGRCRAPGCYRGAGFCPTCNGAGYTTTEKANLNHGPH